jgi:antitoxin CptB
MDGRPVRELLRWRCRRGMKELDLLLERFLVRHYDKASSETQRAFERLLALPDPVLAELLLAPTAGPPDADLAEVVALVAAPAPR